MKINQYMGNWQIHINVTCLFNQLDPVGYEKNKSITLLISAFLFLLPDTISFWSFSLIKDQSHFLGF